jgi:hypothetical protein
MEGCAVTMSQVCAWRVVEYLWQRISAYGVKLLLYTIIQCTHKSWRILKLLTTTYTNVEVCGDFRATKKTNLENYRVAMERRPETPAQ